MSGAPTPAALRQAVLAVSVLDDVDMTPEDGGVLLDGARPARLGWDEISLSLANADPGSAVGRLRLSRMLRLRAWVAAEPTTCREQLRAAVRLLALLADHPVHPGPRWVHERVLGGVLECGLGLADPDESVPGALPVGVAEAAGLDPRELYAAARRHAEGMGALATTRLHRDLAGRRGEVASATDAQLVLRPVGGVDALTMLALPEVRRYLAEADGSGLRAVAVPDRSRGWYDLARIDPAFVQAAWAATDELHRGLPRSALVTAEEVTLAPGGDGVIRLALDDPAVEGAAFWRRRRYV